MDTKLQASLGDEIVSKIEGIHNKLTTQLVYITPNVNYLMYNIINRARKNYVGQFDNPYFPSGQDKVWFPLTETLIKTVRKLLKFSMSDFDFIPLREDTFGLVRMIHFATVAALRRVRFDEMLKRIKEIITIDGSVMVKMSDKYDQDLKKRVLDLQLKDWFNIQFDHTANSLNESPILERFVIPMSEAKSKKNWRNVGDVGIVDPRRLDPQSPLASPTFFKTNEPEFVGWYAWLPIPKAWIKIWNDQTPTDQDFKDYTEGVIVLSNLGEVAKEGDKKKVSIHYIAESPYKKHGRAIKPYKLIRYEHLPGRLPGRGVAESLFDLQLYMNMVANIRMYGNMIRNTVIMFFNPQRTGLRPGDMERLAPTGMIPMNQLDDQAIRFAQVPPAQDSYNEQNVIIDQAQRVTGATDTAQASDAASKSATGNVLDSQYTQTAFEEVKESISHDLIELFEDLIVPFVIDNLDDDEIIAVTGDIKDVEDFDERIIEYHVNKEALKFIEKTKLIPAPDEIEQQKEKLRQRFRRMGNNRYIKLLKGLKDDLKNTEFHMQLAFTDDTMPVETIINELKQMIQLIPPQNLQDVNLDANKVFSLIFDRLGYRYEALKSAKPIQPQHPTQQQTPIQNNTTGNSITPQVNSLVKTGVNPVARAIK